MIVLLCFDSDPDQNAIGIPPEALSADGGEPLPANLCGGPNPQLRRLMLYPIELWARKIF
jgi:hypothetical protein